MNTARALAAIVLATSPLAAAADDRGDVMRVFRAYESLNADLVRSVSAGTGRNGRPYAELRREAEEYAEGPFTQALVKAQDLLCASQDRELLASLLQVIAATSNSAGEAPIEALVQVAKCQPAQLKALGTTLPAKQRTELARRAPELKAVFK